MELLWDEREGEGCLARICGSGSTGPELAASSSHALPLKRSSSPSTKSTLHYEEPNRNVKLPTANKGTAGAALHYEIGDDHACDKGDHWQIEDDFAFATALDPGPMYLKFSSK